MELMPHIARPSPTHDLTNSSDRGSGSVGLSYMNSFEGQSSKEINLRPSQIEPDPRSDGSVRSWVGVGRARSQMNSFEILIEFGYSWNIKKTLSLHMFFDYFILVGRHCIWNYWFSLVFFFNKMLSNNCVRMCFYSCGFRVYMFLFDF